MNFTFTLDEPILKVNCGKDIVLDVDLSRFTPEVNAYAFKYGLKQILSDVHASEKKDVAGWKERSRSLTEKKLASMYAGDVSSISDRSRYEPVEREARRMAVQAINKALIKKGTKLNSIPTETYAKMIDANWPSFRTQAEAFLAEAGKNDTDLDLGALGL